MRWISEGYTGMSTRKEYNDRWNSPIVNPGFTLAEYEAEREKAKAPPREIQPEDFARATIARAMIDSGCVPASAFY